MTSTYSAPTTSSRPSSTRDGNQARLRAHLDRLGWDYPDLAEWLTKLGEPTTRRRVQNWMQRPGSQNAQRCPAWPSLLLERTPETAP